MKLAYALEYVSLFCNSLPIVASFILIFLCFGLGFAFRSAKIFPENTAAVLNRFVIYISLPAITLLQIHRLRFGPEVWLPISMPWILYAIGAIFFLLVGKILKLAPKTIGTLILTGSLGNTSFVGFPLIEALYGPQALPTGILVDQPGSFLVAGTLGILTAAAFSGSRIQWQTILKKVFTFPPFLALVLAILLKPLAYPESFNQILDRLGSTLIPLSLVSVGAQMHFDRQRLRKVLQPLSVGLVFKLLLAPLFFYLLYVCILHQGGEVALVTLIESAMAPMITAGIIAHEYGLDTELSNLMVGIGIPISLVTVPLIAFLLKFR